MVRKKKFFFSPFRSPFPQTLIINYSEHRFWESSLRAFICYMTHNSRLDLANTGNKFTFLDIPRNLLVKKFFLFCENLHKIRLYYVVESVFEKTKKKNFYSKKQLFLGLTAPDISRSVPICWSLQKHVSPRHP